MLIEEANITKSGLQKDPLNNKDKSQTSQSELNISRLQFYSHKLQFLNFVRNKFIFLTFDRKIP